VTVPDSALEASAEGPLEPPGAQDPPTILIVTMEPFHIAKAPLQRLGRGTRASAMAVQRGSFAYEAIVSSFAPGR
jgi:hypothetical protein